MNPENGYNMTTGGDTFEMSKEVKEKKSIQMMGNKRNLGRKLSDETKEKIRKSNTGKKKSDEAKYKMSEAAKKRHTPCSEDKKMKLQKSYPKMRKIYCEETDCVYMSIHECERETGVSATQICAVCRGKCKSAKGYHFRYEN